MTVIPLYGVFMDTLGRKFAMITACSVFGIGTIMCVFSPNIYVLIAARAVAGVSLLPTNQLGADTDDSAWRRWDVNGVGCDRHRSCSIER